MGEAAERDEVPGDPAAMMRRLEQLERARGELDSRVDELDREDERVGAEQRPRAGQPTELAQHDAELVARREAIEAEQLALVAERDRLDAEYTELYARLDAIVDAEAV